MKAVKAAYATLIKSLLIAGSFDVSLHAGVNFVTPIKSLPDDNSVKPSPLTGWLTSALAIKTGE